MKTITEIMAFDMENPVHLDAIPQLEIWSGADSDVLPLDKETIATHPHKLIAFDGMDGNLIGYIAITTQFLPEMVKLGGLVINPDYQDKGYGKLLTETMLENIALNMPDIEIMIAKVNKKSRSIFQKYGAIAVSDKTVYWFFDAPIPMDLLEETDIKSKKKERKK